MFSSLLLLFLISTWVLYRLTDMGISLFRRPKPAFQTSTSSPSTTWWPLFASSALLSALSIANLGLISSMVGWLLKQKHDVHTYQINWPGNPTPLNVEPKNLWTDQGHESNGVAGYGFFLGIFSMITAWRMRNAQRRMKSLTALVVLLFLAVLFTLSAFIFVFVVTYQTTGQYIREPVASNTVGINYPEFHWTPETWFKAVLDLPLADPAVRKEMDEKVTNMVAWRWMLLVILLVDVVTFSIAIMAWLRQRRGAVARRDSANFAEK